MGQSVVHPNHGTGEIVEIKKMDVIEGFNRYYVVEFMAKRLTVHIPVRKTEDLGVRKTMSASKVKQVLQTLQRVPHPLPDDYKERRREIEELLYSGYPVKIAKAVRELTWRDKSNGLSKADSQLLAKGRDMLVAEIALVTNNNPTEAQKEIDEALALAIRAKEVQQEH